MLLVSYIFLTQNLFSQDKAAEKRREIAYNFIDSYNKQDFNGMRKDFDGKMKVFFSKKMMEENYSYTYALKGKARIASYTDNAGSTAIELLYAKDTTEKQKIGLYITKKNKVAGMAVKGVSFKFEKKAEPASVSEARLKERMDSIIRLKHMAAGFDGCVAIVENGKTIYENCAGYADQNNKALLNNNSVFELASCSKQFTSMAILILIERGKINYSDDIRKFIPDLPYENITIENLLTHTSGLPSYEETFDKFWDRKQFAHNADIVPAFITNKSKLNFKPSTKFEYSNTGYAMLSLIIEHVSGMSYNNFLSENIFKPLHMTRSRVYNTRRVKQEKIENYAYGYVYSDSLNKYTLPDSLPQYHFVKWLDGITGDGSVNASISDLVLWENALRNNKLVQKSTLDRAFKSYRLPDGEEAEYGYGWMIQGGEKLENIAYHSGSWPGYVTLMLHFVDHNRSVIILSNNEYQNTTRFGSTIIEMMNHNK